MAKGQLTMLSLDREHGDHLPDKAMVAEGFVPVQDLAFARVNEAGISL
jgi:hypothetical protein